MKRTKITRFGNVVEIVEGKDLVEKVVLILD